MSDCVNVPNYMDLSLAEKVSLPEFELHIHYNAQNLSSMAMSLMEIRTDVHRSVDRMEVLDALRKSWIVPALPYIPVCSRMKMAGFLHFCQCF